MQLALGQLAAHLGKGLQRLYTLHGDEPLQMQEAQDAIRAAARAAGHTERSSFTVSGAHFDWSAPLAAAASLSLFAARQLVEIRIPTGKPGKEGSAALQQLAQAVPDGTLLLITLPRLDKATRASAWFAALHAHGVAVQIDPIARAQLPGWIARRLAAQSQRVAAGEAGQQTLQFFADRIEGNLLAAHQEISKLALLYPAGELSFAQVQQVVLNVARYDVFQLSEAVLGGQLARTAHLLDGLHAEGVAEVLVHWALAEDIRTICRVKAAQAAGQSLPAALRAQRVWGTRERCMEQALARISDARAAQLLQAAHAVDGIVKGLRVDGWPHNAWQALRRLALQVAHAGTAATSGARP